ncbi:PREDICTED: protein hunchback-like isoform X2 [Fragaria vesca subsp. vesca]|uniref:protein hunchback-like isoform X2 n=1 Tax=Fragaria vesca subsp. vesca TaxID=101020 RepID=UPI0002C362DA|nr:PREDICTED: protein hunchback-like isoform X2 [Fragaria vesca subsp. vesca]
MPIKRVPCWKDKPVLLSVYVERPKRRPASLTHRHHHHHHHHHHHYVHHTIKREAISHRDGAAGKGYTTSRRAELLQYSQRLRQSARRAPESSSPSTPYVPNPNHTSNPQPQAEIVTVPKKPKNSKAPTCFGNCKVPTIFGPLLTSFQAKQERKTRKKRGGNSSNKIKAAIKTLKVQKQHLVLIISKAKEKLTTM